MKSKKVREENARLVENLIAELITSGFLKEERFAHAFAGGKFRMNQINRPGIGYVADGGIAAFICSGDRPNLCPEAIGAGGYSYHGNNGCYCAVIGDGTCCSNNGSCIGHDRRIAT